ncbi:MAG: cell envelope biogenesis protein LolA [Flexibacter sp. CG_4_10_14_3_um_filter_32_15]|nr:MAG: cell envelope biogenesis protein LolA [Flexibacter sp. CG_4_10_14_3_um_filter_32_15]
MRKIFIIFIALFFATLATNSTYAQDAQARTLLDAMSNKYKKYNSFRATFTSTLASASENINESLTGTITVRGNKYHLKTQGQEIYNDHKTVWTFLDDANEVTITSYDEADGLNPTDIFDIYKDGYKYVVVEEVKIGGRAHKIIDLVPEDKDLQFFKVRLTIDKENYNLASWNIFEKNGRVHSYKITNFQPNVSVTDADFQFNKTKHPNVEEVDLR